MIDTVVLSIPKNMFHIVSPELFQPNCQSLLNYQNYRGQGLIKAIQNPTRKDVVEKNYKPRLTLENRPSRLGRSVTLRVEFSAPKLLWGNNFDELSNSDFPRVLNILCQKLSSMGVEMAINQLAYAPVVAIHYSKNIVLNDYTSISMILSEVMKANLSLRLDSNTKDYRNEGHCVKFHANSYELVFYDKIKDLQQSSVSEKRAIEKDSSYQMNIFEALDKIVKPFEVLRMELRLGNRRKITSLFKSLGIMNNLNFFGLFNASLAKKILIDYWEKIDEGLSFFQMDAKSPIDLLEAIKKKHPLINSSKLLRLIGSIILIQEVGVRRLRESLGYTKNRSDSWYRLRKELKQIDNLTTRDKYLSVSSISLALNEFKPLRMDDYKLELSKM